MRVLLRFYLFTILAMSCAANQKPETAQPQEQESKGQDVQEGACLVGNNLSLNFDRLSIPYTLEKFEEERDWEQESTDRAKEKQIEAHVEKSGEKFRLTFYNVPESTKMIRLRWLPVNITFYKHTLEANHGGNISIPYEFDFEGAPFLKIIFNESLQGPLVGDNDPVLMVDLNNITNN